MKSNINKINRSIKIYPIFASFAEDLVFFVPIDTLFLTNVKGLNASQITAMTMFSLIICILFQKLILYIVKKIGNVKSLRLGAGMLLIASVILTFGKSFVIMLLYKSIYELAIMFLNMDEIILKNNLKAVNREDEYFKIRNKSKIIYAVITLFTALIAGKIFNINNYLPLYLSIILYTIVLVISFFYYETELHSIDKPKIKVKKIKITTVMFYVILSNAMFYSIIKMGQNNSKLFMQYDFQKIFSIEIVTYYITLIVFLSRIARLFGNVVFGKLYLKIKDKISIVLTLTLSLAFLFLIIGHFIDFSFLCKFLFMALGFFLILAVRDSFQTYIEDVALTISNKNEQQEVIIKIETYRRLGTLILSTIFTLMLIKYELIVIEFILLGLSIIEVFINSRLCCYLKNMDKLN